VRVLASHIHKEIKSHSPPFQASSKPTRTAPLLVPLLTDERIETPRQEMLERCGMGASRYETVVAAMERVANFILDVAAAEEAAAGAGGGLTKSLHTQGMEHFLKVRPGCFELDGWID
jgi:hypothetical protein